MTGVLWLLDGPSPGSLRSPGPESQKASQKADRGKLETQMGRGVSGESPGEISGRKDAIEWGGATGQREGGAPRVAALS